MKSAIGGTIILIKDLVVCLFQQFSYIDVPVFVNSNWESAKENCAESTSPGLGKMIHGKLTNPFSRNTM